MFCPKCGTTVPDNTVFCPNCSSQIAAQAPQQPQPQPQSRPQPQFTPLPQQQKSNSNVLWLVVSICSFLFCCQPVGIGAMICAIMAMCMSAPEQAEKAEACTKWAKILSLAAVGLGILIWGLYFLYMIIMIMISSGSSRY